MNREFLYERRQTASRMEAVMLGASALAALAAVFAFFRGGLLSSAGLLLTGLLAFGLARVFDLLGDLFLSIHSSDENAKPQAAESK